MEVDGHSVPEEIDRVLVGGLTIKQTFTLSTIT